MTTYRTEFMDAVARIVKEELAKPPVGSGDFTLGVTEGKQQIARQIGFLLAGTDTRPQTNDQWESYAEYWERAAKKFETLARELGNACDQYAAEVMKLREMLK